MATVRRHRNKWQVQVRRKDYPALSKSFAAKEDALRWAREQERAADRGELPAPALTASSKTLLSDLLDRYERDVSSRKRSSSDKFHLRPIKAVFGGRTVSELSPSGLAAFRDKRLRQVSLTHPH